MSPGHDAATPHRSGSEGAAAAILGYAAAAYAAYLAAPSVLTGFTLGAGLACCADAAFIPVLSFISPFICVIFLQIHVYLMVRKWSAQ